MKEEITEDQLMGAIRRYLYEDSKPPIIKDKQWHMGRDRKIIQMLVNKHGFTYEEMWQWIRGYGVLVKEAKKRPGVTMALFCIDPTHGMALHEECQAAYHKWLAGLTVRETKGKIKRKPAASHLGSYLQHLANSSNTAEMNGSEETK